VVFGKIDTEAESGLAGALNIRAIPTLMVLRDGVLLASQPGVMPDDVLDELIGQARGLDMDEVRRRLEERQARSAQADAS
jgi:thioredoxin 1